MANPAPPALQTPKSPSPQAAGGGAEPQALQPEGEHRDPAEREHTNPPGGEKRARTKAPLHGCKSPRCCYFIYRCPREHCLLLQNCELGPLPPFFRPFPLAAPAALPVPQCPHRPSPLRSLFHVKTSPFPGNSPRKAHSDVGARSTAQPSHPGCLLLSGTGSGSPMAFPAATGKTCSGYQKTFFIYLFFQRISVFFFFF